MITETITPSANYRVGLVAGVPGAVALALVVTAWVLGVAGVRGAELRPRWVGDVMYLALLFWFMAGPLFLIGVTLAYKTVRDKETKQRASTIRSLVWATCASLALMYAPALFVLAGLW